MWKIVVLDDWLGDQFPRPSRRIEISENKEFRELIGDQYVPLKTEGGTLVVADGFYRGIPVKRRLNVQNMWYRYFVEESLPLNDQHG